MDVILQKNHIYDYVNALTAQVGKNKGNYEKYVCLPDSYPMLDRLMDAAVNELETTLHQHLRDSYATTLQYNATDITLHIDTDSLPPELVGALQTALRLAIAWLLTFLWLQGSEADLLEYYHAGAEQYINTVSSLISQRSSVNADYLPRLEDDIVERPCGFGSDLRSEDGGSLYGSDGRYPLHTQR